MSFFAGAIIAKAVLDTSKWIAGQKTLEKTSGKTGSVLKSLGKATLVASAAVAAGIAASVKKTIEWEKEIGNVSTLVDTSSVDIKAMGDEILALDPKLGSATELTKGLYQALSASVDPADAVRSVGEAAKFARAALIDTNTAVNIGTTLINAYGQTSAEITPAFDKLFTVIKLGKTTGQELSAVIGQSIPLAANMGISFDELGASIAIMTRQGINAANATTQFNAIVNAFLKPSKEMKETLKELGFESGEAAIQSLGFKKALDLVTKTTNGSKEKMAELFSNTRALRGVLALTGEGAKDFGSVLEQLEKSSGATSEAFEKQELTMETLLGAVDRLMIKVGKVFLPIVLDVVESLTDFASGLAENEGFMEALSVTAEIVSFTLKTLLTIVGTVTGAIGRFAGSIINTIKINKELDTSIVKNSGSVLQLSERLDELNKIENQSAEERAEVKKITGELNTLLGTSERNFLAEAEAVGQSVTQLARRELVLKQEELRGQLLEKIAAIEKEMGKVTKDLTKKQKAFNKEAQKVELASFNFKEFSDAEFDALDGIIAVGTEMDIGKAIARTLGLEVSSTAEKVRDFKDKLEEEKETLALVEEALAKLATGTFKAGKAQITAGEDTKKGTDKAKDSLYDLNETQKDVIASQQMTYADYFAWLDEEREKRTQEEINRIAKEKEAEKKALDERIEKYRAYADTISGYAQPIFEEFGKAIKEGELNWESLGGVVRDTIANILEALGKQAAIQSAIAFASLNFVGGTLFAAASALAFTAAGYVRALQGGGFVGANKPVLVGEGGPELFIPKTPGQVVPNNQINNMGKTIVIKNYNNINNASDAELVSRKIAQRLQSVERGI